MKIRYADGNGNVFTITGAARKVLEYDPIKPEFSSSGIYDGGKHVKRGISDADYARVLSAVNAAFDANRAHIENRVMGSGALAIVDKGTERSCILKPGAAELKALESVLTALLG